MKGLILAAGLGTRLKPLTRPPAQGGRSKPLIPLANRPLIAYPLDKLIEAGITEIGIVAGENESELARALAGSAASLSFISQHEPRGLAHAVSCARGFCGDSEFVLLFCDNLFAEPLATALAEWQARQAQAPETAALIHTYEMPDPRACGVAVVQDGWAVELEEKPAVPKSNLAIIGIDILTPLIFEAISRIKPSRRGELEITDAIAELLVLGRRVAARPLDGFWFDTGTFADLIQAHGPVLEQFGSFEIARSVREGSSLHGAAGIGEGSRVTDSLLHGPVLIGRQANVQRCQLGPRVSVGDRCVLADCTLSDCQVYSGTRLSNVSASGAIFDGEYRVGAGGVL